MEKLLPRQVTSEEQREVLQLLCRAHELEVENTELQADNLFRKNLLCQKDFVIQRYHQHRLLCEQVIQGQRQLMQGEPARRVGSSDSAVEEEKPQGNHRLGRQLRQQSVYYTSVGTQVLAPELIKKLNVVAHACSPIDGQVGSGDRWIHGATWPSSLAYRAKSQANGSPCLIL